MGYLIKDDVIKAIREDKETSLMCSSDTRTRGVIEFCYESVEREIDRLTQYRLENVVEKE